MPQQKISIIHVIILVAWMTKTYVMSKVRAMSDRYLDERVRGYIPCQSSIGHPMLSYRVVWACSWMWRRIYNPNFRLLRYLLDLHLLWIRVENDALKIWALQADAASYSDLVRRAFPRVAVCPTHRPSWRTPETPEAGGMPFFLEWPALSENGCRWPAQIEGRKNVQFLVNNPRLNLAVVVWPLDQVSASLIHSDYTTQA